jgi:hypothetical protein
MRIQTNPDWLGRRPGVDIKPEFLSAYVHAADQVWAWFISFDLRKRSLVVVAAACPLMFGAADLRNKPLDVIPEFSPRSHAAMTELLGPSSVEVESLITLPLHADRLSGVSRLRVIGWECMAGAAPTGATACIGDVAYLLESQHPPNREAMPGNSRGSSKEVRGLTSS